MTFFNSIKGRMIASAFVIFSLLMGLAVFDLIGRHKTFMQNAFSQRGVNLSVLLASNVSVPMLNNDLVAINELIEEVREISNVSMIFVTDTSGRVRASYPALYFNNVLDDPVSMTLLKNAQSLTNKHKPFQYLHDGLIDTITPIHIEGKTTGYVRIAIDTQSITEEMNILAWEGILYTLIAIFLGTLFSWLLVRRMTEQISFLSQATSRVAAKDFQVMLPSFDGKDEISTMGRGFRVMIDSIRTQMEQLEEIGKQRLVQSRRYQKALLKWSEIDYENLDTAIRNATEITAQTLGIDRVSVWLLDENATSIVCYDLYSLKEETHIKGSRLERDSFPAYFKALEKGTLIAADDARNHPATSCFTEVYLKPLHIFSMLDVPIIQGGKVVGAVCHESLDAIKEWQPEEQDFALAMGNTVALALEISKRKAIEDQLTYKAYHDELTGLPNRRLLLDRAEQAFKYSERHKGHVGILFLDLDHFKSINDSLGHIIGDSVLIHVTQILQENIRNIDTIARLGGDEFCLIIEGFHDVQEIGNLAAKLIVALQHPMHIDNHELYVTCSIGISVYPDDGRSPETLLRNADSAMYKAKEEGRNSYQFYTEDMTQRAFERISMETSMRRALENGEFVVFYQPQFNGATDRLIGMEALVRWEHPQMGLVSPAKFIPLAVETGLIIAIDRFVLKTAMQQVVTWYAQGLSPGILAINLAIKQLQQEDFYTVLTQMMYETRCQPEWLEFEVTEGEVMQHPEETIETLKRISSMGIKLAIDDFGTGYSSLAYLKRLPVNKLKIDQSFVRGLPENDEDAAIVQAIIALAHSMKMESIAEGVETEEEKAFLIRNGCVNIQGYLYGRPMPASGMVQMLQMQTASETRFSNKS